ncbi:hypothetical protein CYFUS_001268 [Cystobacter fuscus]|uniref:Uncharacterized protein n=1 Tax=Cystobacter fuscus TaxID=43 RepID=A0A250IVT8_9BACT|nr:hypothetical protein [Cystobacter fuscus]ATB35854.1 hypothetical protein CYFUS_001268 [Cystobacter fuscus]
MNNPVASIANAIQRDGGDGIVVVYYPDLGTRDWLVDEVESIAGADMSVRTDSVAEARQRPDALVLLTPVNERAAIEELDGTRDQLLEPRRKHPVVLFLLRDGDGTRALREAPSLASWIRGSDPDPERLAEVDVEAERQAFEAENGASPEEWLSRWRANGIPRDARTVVLSYRASLLEKR